MIILWKPVLLMITHKWICKYGCRYNLPLNKKWVSNVVNEKSFFRSAPLIFKILFFIIRSTAKSVVSSSGMLANKLQTSNHTRNFLLELRFLISCTKKNESLAQYFCGINGVSIELRYFAKL